MRTHPHIPKVSIALSVLAIMATVLIWPSSPQRSVPVAQASPASGPTAQALSDDNALASLTVSPGNIIGFDPERTTYFTGVHPNVTQVTVTATPRHRSATVAHNEPDADDNIPGMQAQLFDGTVALSVTVTSEQGTERNYDIHVSRGTDHAQGRNSPRDLDGFEAADNQNGGYIWSDGDTMWVADSDDDKLYAYSLTDNIRRPSREFSLHADNSAPSGIWSDGETIWVADQTDDKLYAYRLSNGTRRPSLELDLHPDNTLATGIWSDGTTMWVADHGDGKVYAYRLSGGKRLHQREFRTQYPEDDLTGIWSDGQTMWVAKTRPEHIYAYRLADGTRDRARGFTPTDWLNVFHRGPFGLWSNGAIMYAGARDKIFAYNLYDHDDIGWVRDMGDSLVHLESLSTPGPARLDASYRSNLPIMGARQGPRLETIFESAKLMSMVIGETYDRSPKNVRSGIYINNLTRDCGLLHQSFTSACEHSVLAGRNPGQPIPDGAGNDIEVLYDGVITAWMLITIYQKPIEPDGIDDADRQRRTLLVPAPTSDPFICRHLAPLQASAATTKSRYLRYYDNGETHPAQNNQRFVCKHIQHDGRSLLLRERPLPGPPGGQAGL